MATTFTIPYDELKRLVEVAAPHAGVDAFLPVFRQVRIRSRRGCIEATATDRYTAVWVAGEVKIPDGCEFGLAVKDWKHCLSIFRPARGSSVTLRITVGGSVASVERVEGTLFGPSDIRVTYEVVDGAYPKIDHLRNDMSKVDKRSDRPAAFNPRYLARFPRDNQMAFISGIPGKPSWIVGPDYCIAIMGVSAPAGQVDEWIANWATEDGAEVVAS